MDYFTLLAMQTELAQELINARITHVVQLDSCILVLNLRGVNNEYRSLIMETTGRHPGVFLSSETLSLKTNTDLSRSLKNKLTGAVISDIRMPLPDRYLVFDLAFRGWKADRCLWFEGASSRGNVSLTDSRDDTIIECLTKVTLDINPDYPRLPGLTFRPQHNSSSEYSIPLDSSLNYMTLKSLLIEHNGQWNIFLKRIHPMTPALAKFLTGELKKNQPDKFNQTLRNLIQNIRSKQFTPHIRTEKDRIRLHALFLPAQSTNDHFFDSMIIAADEWRKEIQAKFELNDLRNMLIHSLKKRCDRVNRNLKAAQNDFKQLKDPAALQRRADLLAANFHCLKRGMKVLSVVDFFDPNNPTVELSLNPKLTPQKQLDSWFREAKKQKRAGPAILNRIDKLTLERKEIQRWLQSVQAAETMAPLLKIQSKLENLNLISPIQHTSKRKLPEGHQFQSIRRFRSSDGYNIFVGRGAKANDYLSFRFAKPDDLWLHAKDSRGAHVVIRNRERNKTVPEPTIQEAAKLAIYFSKARGERAVPVIVTRKNKIRKAPGNIPGRVILVKHQTITQDSPENSEIALLQA